MRWLQSVSSELKQRDVRSTDSQVKVNGMLDGTNGEFVMGVELRVIIGKR